MTWNVADLARLTLNRLRYPMFVSNASTSDACPGAFAVYSLGTIVWTTRIQPLMVRNRSLCSSLAWSPGRLPSSSLALGYNAGEDISSFAISALSHLASSSISSFVRGFRSSSFAHSAARLVSASFWCPPTLPSSPSSHSCTLSPSPGSPFTLGIT